jgi:hypothetical protein
MSDNGFMPSMLIDVGSNFGRGPKLHVTQDGEKAKWCCLSYCWGGDQLIKTIKATRTHFMHSIPWGLLPKTIQDAISTARVLEIPYLWVDSLCITQDDAGEMRTQTSLMSEIYKRAHFTIVASSASRSAEGFLHRRDLEQSDCPIFSLPYRCPDGQLGSVYFFSDNGYDPRKEPVRQRAWTLQERLLSSRILDYGTRQMRWACRKQFLGDGGYRYTIPSGAEAADRLNPRIFGNPRTTIVSQNFNLLQDWDALWSWNWIVEDYTRRHLTMAGDKLPAISGVAREYGEAFGATYLAGMFEEILPESLLWSVQKGTQRMRPSFYRAPTFSWAAIDSPITWHIKLSTTLINAVQGDVLGTALISYTWGDVLRSAKRGMGGMEVLETHSKPVQSDIPYGLLSYCYLKVKCRVCEAKWHGVSDFAGDARLSTVNDSVEARADAIDGVYLKLCQSVSVPVYLLGVLGNTYCLVAVSDDDVNFQRVGCTLGEVGALEWTWRDIILV